MRALKAILFGINKKDSAIYIRAVERVKKGVLNRKDQEELNAHHLSTLLARLVGASISIVSAYYIPIPDFLYPKFWRFCTFILCYRSICIPVLLSCRDFDKGIAIKYDLLHKPELLNPPARIIYDMDQILDRGKDGKNETFSEYKERNKETDKRLREAYELDKRYKKSVSNESFEAYRDRKLSEERIKAAEKNKD